MVRRFVAFAECVDEAVDWFCAVCDGPRLAYGHWIDPPKPPTLVGPMDEGGRRWVPSRQKLLRLVEVLEYFHAVRKHRQSVSFAELARAVYEGGDERILSASFLRGCPYVREISRRRRPGEPRQGYVKLDVKKPWETLGDVIEVLNDREGGGADVDLVVKVFYSLFPGFNKLLPKGLSNLRDLFVAFPGTFEVSSDGKVRCVAAFDDPEPEREIPGCYRNDVHTREDLEGIVSLADAAAKYPGVKSGYSISVGALMPGGGNVIWMSHAGGVLAALGVFCMVFARVVITDLERAKFAVTGGVVAIAGLRRSEQLFGWWVRRTVSRLVKRWRMLLTVGFLALGVIWTRMDW